MSNIHAFVLPVYIFETWSKLYSLVSLLQWPIAIESVISALTFAWVTVFDFQAPVQLPPDDQVEEFID